MCPTAMAARPRATAAERRNEVSKHAGLRRTIRGEEYVTKVLLVKGRHKDGRPRECVFIDDDESVKLEGGEEFIVVFVPLKVWETKAN